MSSSPNLPNLPKRLARLVLPMIAAVALAETASAQTGAHPTETPNVAAVRREGPVQLDGALDEAFWAAAAPATDFRQTDPNEGRPATQRTEVRFAFDDQALYVGARMHDSLGAAGVRTRLARRDAQVDGDYLSLVFDTWHDHSGRTEIRVNPSGVKYDAGQGTLDSSWDPVWEAATRVDSAGWTAELRIPLSQLRYARDSVQTWGLQVYRYVERLREYSQWSFWGKQEAGGANRYGHLEGLRLPGRPRSVEVMPYAVARGAYVTPTQSGNPFQNARDYDLRVGADVKAMLGSSFTLSATVNPDFGQVELDPAVVNLSAFETYYSERRPFFVEGSGTLGFGGFSCRFCSNVSSLSLFYSRRIGRSPQGWLPFDTRFQEVPTGTEIVAAAKLTGRTRDGWQVGVLDAVTAPGKAQAVDRAGDRVTREVEPLTNYFVGRVRRTSRGGNLNVGVMATSVVRSFGYDSLRHQLPSRAEALGIDWSYAWKDRTYSLMGSLAVSQVAGDSLAIGRLQRSSARYFQRPDRDEHGNGVFTGGYDPSLTALRGYGGYLRLAKDAGDLRFESMVNFRSPGFEVNDLAFLTRTDYVWMNTNVWRNWTKPTSWYRVLGAVAGAQQQHNWDGDLIDRQLHASTFIDFKNWWGTGAFLIHRPQVMEDRLTRGGPVVVRPAYSHLQWWLFTDSRKPVVLGTEPWYGWTADGGRNWRANLDVRLKPASNVQLSLSPTYNYSFSRAQHVAGFDDATATHFGGRRVVFAELEQKTLSMDTRLNVTFTPELSLELFAQPYVSTGQYSRFKEYDGARTLDRTAYDAGQLTPLVDARTGRDTLYVLNPDRDAATASMSFRNPDFNFRSLRGSAVVRWEWRPGSTLFFVWQQQRSGREAFGDFDAARDAGAVFRERPDNIFVVKATYWLGR